MPYVARISLFPIKSLDGVDVTKATMLSSSALQYDREYAMFDEGGKFVNAKRNLKVHLLRCEFSLSDRSVCIQIPGSKSLQFHLDQERQLLEAVLTEFFEFPVKLEQNTIMGFPDDTNSLGPTIISTPTLREVASWFPDMSIEELRRRLRANIEIDGDIPPFWEDKLFAVDGVKSFYVGDVNFFGVNPCARCIVPTRDSYTGEAYLNFQKIFVSKRQETLPVDVALSRFNHFFRLSVNTKLPMSEAGKTLQIGDEVEIEKCKLVQFFT
jgi:hypothetical protein